ncbi:hypothetical protein GOV03_04745, partial [Candidatus Woesearchaeota archaeon]|nr:hypothetical protein [Candidatus Woesearchaeota archaeon]
MDKITVLGAGNMGSYIATRLADEYEVTAVDGYQSSLDKITNGGVAKVQADLADPENIRMLTEHQDLVVTALPEAFGYQALKTVLESGANVVDISFWDQTPERVAELDALAKLNDSSVLIDCGIAPGLSNALVAYFDHLLAGGTVNASVYVGGIPLERERDYFSSWSVPGLIEEYTRDALIVKNGVVQKVPALSELETIYFPGVGELVAGVTDGLRSLPTNLRHITNMGEYTLRYPGHFKRMQIISGVGYFSEEPLEVGQDEITARELTKILWQSNVMMGFNGFDDDEKKYPCVNGKIVPRDVAVEVLSKAFQMKPEDRDTLVMRVQAEDDDKIYSVDLCGKHDGKHSAMALTTGGMAVLAAEALTLGVYEPSKGALPLEKVIQEDP